MSSYKYNGTMNAIISQIYAHHVRKSFDWSWREDARQNRVYQ